MVGREREQPEVVVVRFMAMGRTRAAIPHFAKIVDRLLDVLVLRGTDSKFRDCPAEDRRPPSGAMCGKRIGIVAEQDKTLRSPRRVRPLQRWREVFSIAGEAPLRRRTRLKRASWLSPSGCRRHWLGLDEFLRDGLDLTSTRNQS